MSSVGKELDNLEDKVNWHWRYSMQPVRFFMFDARAALPFVLLIFYARLSTLVLAIVTLAFFRFLEGKGLTYPAAMRNFRAWIIGRYRPGWVSALRNKFVDYR